MEAAGARRLALRADIVPARGIFADEHGRESRLDAGAKKGFGFGANLLQQAVGRGAAVDEQRLFAGRTEDVRPGAVLRNVCSRSRLHRSVLRSQRPFGRCASGCKFDPSWELSAMKAWRTACRPRAPGASTIIEGLSKRSPSKFSGRSEEHTSELQSRQYLVCRLLLEKKK